MRLQFGDTGTYLIGIRQLSPDARTYLTQLTTKHLNAGDDVKQGNHWVAISGVTPGEGYTLRATLWPEDAFVEVPLLYLPEETIKPCSQVQVNGVIMQLGQILDTVA